MVKGFQRVVAMLLIVLTLVTMLPVSGQAASVTYYQTSKTEVPIWSEASSKSTKIRTVSSQGTVLKVTGSTTNSAGNLWYKLSDGTWVFSGNVTRHTHAYTGGICNGNGCGYEYPLTVSGYSGTFVVTNTSGAKIWSRPYSKKSSHIRTAGHNSVLTITHKTTNEETNLWYKLSDGNWVFSENVAQRHTISYNANGGSGAPGSHYAVHNVYQAIPSTKPTRSGYLFQGWGTSSGDTTVDYKPGSSYKFTGSKTLYAIWKACSHDYTGGICDICGYEFGLSVSSYSGTFLVTNESGAKIWSRPYSNKSNHIRTAAYNSALTVSYKTTNEENHLWYRLSDGYWVYSKNVAQRFDIKYNANGGTGAPAAHYAVDGVSRKISSVKPTRPGYLFQGWGTSSGDTSVDYKPGSSYVFTGHKTLYAIWKACSHDYTGGICDVCGHEYALSISAYSGTFVVTNEKGAKIWSRPYSNKSNSIRTAAHNGTLTVTHKTTNEEVHVWYQLSDGNWVYSENVAQRFDIKYNANGGTGAPAAQYAVDGVAQKLSAKKPTRTGYTFQGWGTSASDTTVNYKPGSSYTFSGHKTLYAIWKVCEHAYTGGICDACGYEFGLTVSAFSGTFVVTNEKGAKIWSRPYSKNSRHIRTAALDSVLTVSHQTKNEEKNIWYQLSDGNWVFSENVAQRFTIRYNANGGSGAPESQYAVKDEYRKLSTKKPTRGGYTFQGWGTSSGDTSVDYKPGSSYKFTSDKTLYAIWKPCDHKYTGGICDGCGHEYALKTEACSGEFGVTNEDGAKIWSRPYSKNSKHIRTDKYKKVLTVKAKVENEEKNIWYQLSDGNWVFSGNVGPRYTIRYNANGGSGAPSEQKAISTIALKLSTGKPVRGGYTFQGWGTSSGDTSVDYKPGSSYKFTSDKTLYAIWKPCAHEYTGGICDDCGHEYGLTVTAHSGVYAVTNEKGAKIWSRPYSKNAKHLRTASRDSALTVTGKTVNEEDNLWYQLTDGSWVYSGNVSQRFTITYNANGGSGAPGPQYAVKGVSRKLTTKKPTWNGYTFRGWGVSAGDTSVAYKPGASYKFTSDKTLFAIWKPCEHAYTGGICDSCGYEYPLYPSTFSGEFGVKNEDGAKVWSRPYSKNAKHIRTEKYKKALTIVAMVENQDRNIWYQLSDGNWVYSGNVGRRHTIRFDFTGGSGGPDTCYAIEGISQTLSKKKPERMGYKFLGWGSSTNDTTVDYKAGSSYKFSSDKTLYAIWKECAHKYTGGICDSCGYEYPLEIEEHSGKYVVTNEKGGKVWSRPYSEKSKNIRTEKENKFLTVTAKVKNQEKNIWYQLSDGNWIYSGNAKRRYDICYDANGGKGAPGDTFAADGVSKKLSTKKPTKDGYLFQGWGISPEDTSVNYKPGSSYKFTSDKTLYAIWKACKHEYDGGICEKCGYEFELKYTALSGEVMITNKDGGKIWSRPYSNNSKKVRTEKYRKILKITAKVENQEKKLWYQLSDGNWVYSGNVTQRFTIRYDANGGEGGPEAQTVLQNYAMQVSTAQPNRAGYAFQGWGTSASTDVVSYKPGMAYTFTRSRTLYAVWSTCSHSYNDQGLCGSCGKEKPYKITELEEMEIHQIIGSGRVSSLSRPFSGGSDVVTLRGGDLVRIVAKAVIDGNHWYQLIDGSWVQDSKLVLIGYVRNGEIDYYDTEAKELVTTVARISKSSQKAIDYLEENVGPIDKMDTIPGLNKTVTRNSKETKVTTCSDMVPQGMTFAGEYLLISAYCHCSKAHMPVIYVLDNDSREYLTTLILDEQCHVGGLARLGDYLWVCDSGPDSDHVERFLRPYRMSDIDKAVQIGVNYWSLTALDEEPVKVKPSYLCAANGYLYVGTHYKTKEEARIYYYSANGATLNEVGHFTVKGINKIQGISIRDNTMILSCSRGAASVSHVYVYKDDSNFTTDGAVYSEYDRAFSFANMVEACYIGKSYTYFLFESGAKEYRSKTGARPLDQYIGFKTTKLTD